LQFRYNHSSPLNSLALRDVKQEVRTHADSARPLEPQLPGLERPGAFGPVVAPVPRIAGVIPVANGGEQLSERTARRVQREMRGLLAELHDVTVLDRDATRAGLSAIDCFTRRVAPVVLRLVGQEDLASALENLPEISGPSGIERALGVFSALTYLVDGAAGQVFYAAVEALEMPTYGGDEEVDRGALPMRSFPASFQARLTKAVARAEHVVFGEESAGEHELQASELQALRPSVEVTVVAAGPKLRSIAS
jgi:hypothetical protein